MSAPAKAIDLLPLVALLPHDEQVQLARLALRAAALGRPADAAYRARPPTAEEFGDENDALAWDAAGWEDVGEAR